MSRSTLRQSRVEARFQKEYEERVEAAHRESVAELARRIEQLYERIRCTKDARERIEQSVDIEIAAQVTGSAKAARRYQEKLAKLAAEREKLLRAYYADAIPLDLLKKEQQRIDDEVLDLRDRVEVDREKLERARKTVDIAVRLLTNCHRSYRVAGPLARRKWNQAPFERIYVGRQQIRALDYREPFATILSRPSSNEDLLVSQEVCEFTT